MLNLPALWLASCARRQSLRPPGRPLATPGRILRAARVAQPSTMGWSTGRPRPATSARSVPAQAGAGGQEAAAAAAAAGVNAQHLFRSRVGWLGSGLGHYSALCSRTPTRPLLHTAPAVQAHQGLACSKTLAPTAGRQARGGPRPACAAPEHSPGARLASSTLSASAPASACGPAPASRLQRCTALPSQHTCSTYRGGRQGAKE